MFVNASENTIESQDDKNEFINSFQNQDDA